MATIPSIALIPSGYKANKVYSVLPTDGSGDLDFARTSTATRVNQNGLIEEVAIGVPRLDYTDGSCPSLLLEPSSTNLITQSESFGNTYWAKSGASIEGDASTAGSEEVVNGDFATDSDWSKGTGWSISSGKAIYDGTGGTSNILQSGVIEVDKFYKVSIDVVSNEGSGANTIFLGGMVLNSNHLEIGTHIFYGQTTNTNVNLDIYGRSGEVFEIDNISVKEVEGFSAPSVDSPLGAFKLVEDTSTGSHRVYKPNIIVSDDSNTLSIKAKASGRNWIVLRDGETGEGCYFDLENGVVGAILGSPDSYSITALADGWYDISLTVTTTTLKVDFLVYTSTNGSDYSSYTGDGTSGVYIFGAQLERKSYATSYIPTAGTIISRTADSASKSGISSLINSEEGVLYFEGSWVEKSGGSNRRISLSDGTTNNRVLIQNVSGGVNRLQFYFINAGGTQVEGVFNAVDITDTMKIAFKFKVNDFAVWINGVEVITDSSGTTFSEGVLNRLGFDGGSGSLDFYGKCKDLRVYKTALSDAELQILTTI